jgi:CheY-specific phosphatase CheX
MPVTCPPELLADLVHAVIAVLRASTGIDATASPRVVDPATPRIAVEIDLAGDIDGALTWRFPHAVALELVRRLLDVPVPDPTHVPEGATELANILTGRASAVLDDHGLRCEIGPPKVVGDTSAQGVHVHLTTREGTIDVVLPLASERE